MKRLPPAPVSDAQPGSARGSLSALATQPRRAVQPEVERELVVKCQGGDARFYEPLVRAYEPSGMRVALGMMGNADDARDALQEAFVKA